MRLVLSPEDIIGAGLAEPYTKRTTVCTNFHRNMNQSSRETVNLTSGHVGYWTNSMIVSSINNVWSLLRD